MKNIIIPVLLLCGVASAETKFVKAIVVSDASNTVVRVVYAVDGKVYTKQAVSSSTNAIVDVDSKIAQLKTQAGIQ